MIGYVLQDRNSKRYYSYWNQGRHWRDANAQLVVYKTVGTANMARTKLLLKEKFPIIIKKVQVVDIGDALCQQ